MSWDTTSTVGMGTAGGGGLPDYCAAKSGILGLTRSLAREVSSRGIRVNAIAPGWIETAMTEVVNEMRPLLEAQTPLGCFGEPDDIAWAGVYLARHAGARFTGGLWRERVQWRRSPRGYLRPTRGSPRRHASGADHRPQHPGTPRAAGVPKAGEAGAI